MQKNALAMTPFNEEAIEHPVEGIAPTIAVTTPPCALADSLQEIEPTALEPLNTIFYGSGRFSFDWPDGSICAVDLLPGFTHRLPGELNPELLIEARLGEHRVCVGLAATAFLELLDGENAALLPPEIKCALIESYLETAVWTFEQAAGLLISITSVRHGPKTLPDLGYNLFFELIRHGEGSASTGYISMDYRGLCRLAASLMHQGRSGFGDQMPELQIPMGFVIGRSRLSLREIRTLSADDIVLIEGISTGNCQALPIWVDLGGRTAWLAKMSGNQLVVEAGWEHAMEEDAKETVRENEEVVDLDNIQLELVFELGRKTLPLAEVRRIQPGYIFDLTADFEKPVSILINGGPVGFGELVKIDHRLGVRLTQKLKEQEQHER